LILSVADAGAQVLDKDVSALIDKVSARAIEIRHDIHQNPELSNREVRTAELVAKELRSLGLQVKTGIARTGVVGVLRGKGPGPVIAVRADMDALPVTETADLPFKSSARATYMGQEVGVSHACGHDIHVAAALGAASVLSSLRDRFNGTVMFIFQPRRDRRPARRVARASWWRKASSRS
jgi:amidohydrolase